MNRGYVGYSKSVRAVEAERDEKMTATALAKKLGVSAAAVKHCCEPCEWHHTSKMFNRTHYYHSTALIAVSIRSFSALLEAARELGEVDSLRNARKRLAEMKEFDMKRAGTAGSTVAGCTVEWLEWGGTTKHPKATECIATGVTVVWKGGCFVQCSGGTLRFPLKKKIGTRGFRVMRDGKTVSFT